MRHSSSVLVVAITLLLPACGEPPSDTFEARTNEARKPPPSTSPALRAGLRASSYGISPYPPASWWVSSINSMASNFTGAVGEQVAVVVEVSGGGGRGKCWAHFPNPTPATTWPNV